MPNSNDTSDLINFIIEAAQAAAVFVAIVVAILWMFGPGAVYLVRAAIIDPAIKQWNAPIPSLDGSAQIRQGDYFGIRQNKNKTKVN